MRTRKKTTDGTIADILGVRSKTNQRREHDAYMTQDVFVKALCEVEIIPHRVWEPFAGDGKMAHVIGMYSRYEAIESDIKPKRGSKQKKLDFLEVRKPLARAIISNPPWSLPVWNMAELCIRHAHAIGITYLVFLLKAHYLNAECRAKMVDEIGHPNRIWILASRPDFTGQGSPPMLASWYVWDGWNAEHSITKVLRVEKE